MEEKLILENEGLIYYILNQYKLNKEEYYDLGMIGLVKASKTYTEEKGKFSTYACECIKHEVLKDLQSKRCQKRTGMVVSLDEEIIGTDIPLLESIPAGIDIEADMIRNEKIKRIQEAIRKLTAEEQYIIKASYGIDGVKKSVRILTEELNMTTNEVNAIKRRATRRLRGELRVWKARY